jgi:hypothetical protein
LIKWIFLLSGTEYRFIGREFYFFQMETEIELRFALSTRLQEDYQHMRQNGVIVDSSPAPAVVAALQSAAAGHSVPGALDLGLSARSFSTPSRPANRDGLYVVAIWQLRGVAALVKSAFLVRILRRGWNDLKCFVVAYRGENHP